MTDPEEGEAKKGELLLCSILILPLDIHNSVVYSFNRYFLTLTMAARPCFWTWEEADRQVSALPEPIYSSRAEARDYMIHKQQDVR